MATMVTGSPARSFAAVRASGKESFASVLAEGQVAGIRLFAAGGIRFWAETGRDAVRQRAAARRRGRFRIGRLCQREPRVRISTPSTITPTSSRPMHRWTSSNREGEGRALSKSKMPSSSQNRMTL